MHLAEVKQGQLQGGNGLPRALEQLKARSPPPSPPLTPSQGRHPGKVHLWHQAAKQAISSMLHYWPLRSTAKLPHLGFNEVEDVMDAAVS